MKGLDYMKNQTVLITGASRGIGKALAETFAASGANLIITCHHSTEQLTRLQHSLQDTYRISCQTFVGDLGDEDCVQNLYHNIEEIDILINNAGISYIGLLQDMTLVQWNRLISSNLTSAFLCSKYAIPLMLQRKSGKILNISSVWGNIGASTEAAYSASKGGLNAFTKALAKELAPSNIQVNAIACGLIDTEMNNHLSSDELQQIINEIPAGRIGLPEDVAKLAFDLCKNHSYLTGQIITLDGGWT